MEDTLFSRLDKFMQYKGLNDNKITVQTHIAVGTLGKQRRSGKGLSYESIVKILNTYPELSPSWLLLGKGEMLINKELQPLQGQQIINEKLSTLETTIKKQHEKIDLLISQLDYMRTQIAINQGIERKIAQHFDIDLGKL